MKSRKSNVQNEEVKSKYSNIILYDETKSRKSQNKNNLSHH